MDLSLSGTLDSVMVPFPPGYGQISHISVPNKMAQMVKTYFCFFDIFNTASFPKISKDTVAGIVASGMRNTLILGLDGYLEADAQMERTERGVKRNILVLGEVKDLRQRLLDGVVARIQERVVQSTKDLFNLVLPHIGRLYGLLENEGVSIKEKDAARRFTDFVDETFKNYEDRVLATPEELARKIEGGSSSRELRPPKKDPKVKSADSKNKPVTPSKEGCVASAGAGDPSSPKVTERAVSNLFIKTFYAMAGARKASRDTVLHPRVASFVHGSLEEGLQIRRGEEERRGAAVGAYSDSEVIEAHAIPQDVLQVVFQEGFDLHSEKTPEWKKIKCCITKDGESRILEATSNTKEGVSVLYHFVNRAPREKEKDWFTLCEEPASDESDWFDVAGYPYQMDSKGNLRYIDRDRGNSMWIFHRKRHTSFPS